MWPGIHNCRTGSVIQPSIRITEWAVENGILPQHRKAAGLIVVALWERRSQDPQFHRFECAQHVG
jgi:hypothetical protein